MYIFFFEKYVHFFQKTRVFFANLIKFRIRMSGLALVVYGKPKYEYDTPSPAYKSVVLRSKRPAPEPTHQTIVTDESIIDFETFLEKCTFCLLSADRTATIDLQKTDVQTADGRRPAIDHLLPNVTIPEGAVLSATEQILSSTETDSVPEWCKLLSRYQFNLNPATEHRDLNLLHEKEQWVLSLKTITDYNGLHFTSYCVCIPQRWLPQLTHAFFEKNAEQWNFEQSTPEVETFGIPSARSIKEGLYCDIYKRYHFRICNTPSKEGDSLAETRIGSDVSEVEATPGVSSLDQGIPFPASGTVYVILFNLPEKILLLKGRTNPHAASYNAQENQPEYQGVQMDRSCPICFESITEKDVGRLMLCKNRHFVCNGCRENYVEVLQSTTNCFFCRERVSINPASYAGTPPFFSAK